MYGLDRQIDFLKVDTEGFDARVLHGAESLLRNHKLKFIFWESNVMQSQVGDTLYDTVQYLKSLGYASYLFGSEYSIPLNDKCKESALFASTDTANVYSTPDFHC